MAHILLTGIAVLDIINHVSTFPEEDTEIRACGQSIRRGGNASNSATILSQLKHDCMLAAPVSDDAPGQFIVTDLKQNNIQLATSCLHHGYTTPTSYITLNQENGSRTIIHYRNLPELCFNQFDQIDLKDFIWFHFEARNTPDVHQMMFKAREFNKVISLEAEKERDNLDLLFPLADIIFFSRPFALSRGFVNAQSCLQHFNKIHTDKLLVCTWGSDGAYAMQGDLLFSSSAFYIDKAVDTIGAGDTFIAGFIHSQLSALSIQDSLIYACRLAGLKCSQTGFDNLENIYAS